MHRVPWWIRNVVVFCMAYDGASSGPLAPRSLLSLAFYFLTKQCFSQGVFYDCSFGDLFTWPALHLHPPPPGRMSGWVYAMDHAVMPPDTALAQGPGSVLLVLAVLAVDCSEPFGGSELHPPRFLRLIAHAAR